MEASWQDFKKTETYAALSEFGEIRWSNHFGNPVNVCMYYHSHTFDGPTSDSFPVDASPEKLIIVGQKYLTELRSKKVPDLTAETKIRIARGRVERDAALGPLCTTRADLLAVVAKHTTTKEWFNKGGIKVRVVRSVVDDARVLCKELGLGFSVEGRTYTTEFLVGHVTWDY